MKTLWQQVFQYVLGGMTVLGVFAIVVVLIFADLAPSVKDPLLVLLGVLASGFMAIMNYFFGSSKGSSDKNTMINNPSK